MLCSRLRACRTLAVLQRCKPAAALLSRRNVPRISFSTSPAVRSSSLPIPPPIAQLPDPNAEPQSGKKNVNAEDVLGRARQWVDRFKQLEAAALRDAKGVEMSFSRSSGPGGQNVNKVNTKVTLRCAVDAPWVPAWAKESLVRDPHYTASSHSILVTSTTTRSQSQNIDDCLSKLRTIVLNAATAGLKNPTSEETKKRVEEHVKADKARKRMEKEKRSSVKKHRSFKGYD